MRIVLFILCLTSLSLFAVEKAQIAATVNGKTISREEFEQSYKENQLLLAPFWPPPKKFLMTLLTENLGLQRQKKIISTRIPS